MTYTNYQHWDPLKVCIVGRSYPADFYNFINNERARIVMERIARETEEDYQKLISKLQEFNVEVLRPDVENDYTKCLGLDGKIVPPPMTPRDYTACVDNKFYISDGYKIGTWKKYVGESWPNLSEIDYNEISAFILQELKDFEITDFIVRRKQYSKIVEFIRNNTEVIYNININSAQCYNIGKDLYFGTEGNQINDSSNFQQYLKMFPKYRCHMIDTYGHADSTWRAIKPGLIISTYDIGLPTFAKEFPGWEVIQLGTTHYSKIKPFLKLKEKNQGKWWVPGEELNDDFTEYVESWFGHWFGYMEETIFDINLIIIDEKNVIVTTYDEKVFDAFARHGITPHMVNFRHRWFWDGGLHCITSDVHRDGSMKDYFPERG